MGRIERRLGLFEFDLDGALDDLFWEQEPLRGETELERAAYLLGRAQRVLVFAGSGLSAESGVATFRDEQEGVYEQPSLQEMTRTETFEVDPEAQLAWHQRWRDELEHAPVHPGQRALVRLSQGREWSVATQNVDHLLERAAAEQGATLPIWHLHGELTRVRCHDCGHTFEDPNFDFIARPPCPQCGGRLRPDVVWFGEQPPAELMERARDAARRAEVCLLLGTSGVVYPAAALPEIASAQGARLLEINPSPTPLSPMCDVTVRARAGQALPRIEELVRSGMGSGG